MQASIVDSAMKWKLKQRKILKQQKMLDLFYSIDLLLTC